MNFNEYLQQINNEIQQVTSEIDPIQADKLLIEIENAKRIYVLGAGRSKLMMMAFAMRLMQIGYQVYVVGEIVTPALLEGDLLIIGSGSGETAGLVLNTNKAKNIGAKIAVITINPASSLGKLGDLVIVIPTSTEKSNHNKSIQPGGSTFEQCLMLFGDAVILNLLEKADPSISVMTRHANLE